MRRTIPWGALALLLATAPAAAGVASVWAIGDGDKIARDGAGSPLAKGNAAWDGRTARLVAARNEIVAFQVIVEADAAGLAAVSVALPELGKGDARIVYSPPVVDPSLSVGRPIQLFSVNDMYVTADVAGLVGLGAREPGGSEEDRGLEAGPARARERASRARRLPAPVAPGRAPGLLDRGVHGARPPGGDVRGGAHRHRRRPVARPSGRRCASSTSTCRTRTACR